MMIDGKTLHIILMGVILSIVFVVLSFKMLWYMMGSFIKAPFGKMHFMILSIVLDFFVFTMIMGPFLYMSRGYVVPEIWDPVMKIPKAFWIIYCIASGLYTMNVRYNLVKWRQTHVTYKTLHQSIDNLPMGVCVYNSKGILQMANYQMHNLCKRYTGKPLLNGLSWEKAITALPDLMLHFSEEEVWHFRKIEQEDNVTLLTAINVSEEMMLNKELQIENIQLEGINNRLRQYGLDLEDIIKQEELLNTQIRVHDELGHILLTSRVFMNGSDFAVSEEQLKKEWKQLLLSMKEFTDTASDNSQIDDLMKAAETLGIRIVIDGSLPGNQTMKHLLASAARECLTNAAKAAASCLWINITNPSAKHPTTEISFINDGNPPVLPIREGVGLGTLRQIVEREGAVMTIKAEDRFCLTIER